MPIFLGTNYEEHNSDITVLGYRKTQKYKISLKKIKHVLKNMM